MQAMHDTPAVSMAGNSRYLTTCPHPRLAGWCALPLALGVLVAAGCSDATNAVGPAPPTGPSLVSSRVTSIIGLEPLIDATQNVSQAYDISDFGQVVGSSDASDGNDHAVIWDNSVFPQDLGLLLNVSGSFSEALAITPDGTVIVGYAYAGGQRAVRWVKLNGAWTIDALPTPAAATGCLAKDIAGDGTIVGSCTVDGWAHVTVWQNGVATVLAPGVATGVNSSGQIAGYNIVNDVYQAFVLDFRTAPATSSPIEGLGGSPVFTGEINDAGEVAGYSRTGTDGPLHAFRWTPRKGAVDLGTLGGTASEAHDISSTGEVVGSSPPATGGLHAVYWARGKIVDLGVLAGYTHSRAKGINENGQIVGTSFSLGAPSLRATLWTVK